MGECGSAGVVPSLASGGRRFGLAPRLWVAAGSLGLLACATYTDESGKLGSGGTSAGGGAGGGGSSVAGGGSNNTAGTPSSSSGSPATGGGGSAAAGSGGMAGGAGGGGAAGTAGAGGAGGADGCPDDPNKTAPGKCGCGAPDEDSVFGASCLPLQDAIVHRYSFENDANDSVGTSHGTLVGGATIAGGALTLAGGTSGQYLDLPNGLVSSLTNATLEAWVTWTGSAGGMWQRVFDFGSSTMAEGQAGNGNKYLFLSTVNFRACYTSATPPSEIFADSGAPFPRHPGARGRGGK